jgi:hypothetical protein
MNFGVLVKQGLGIDIKETLKLSKFNDPAFQK